MEVYPDFKDGVLGDAEVAADGRHVEAGNGGAWMLEL